MSRPRRPMASQGGAISYRPTGICFFAVVWMCVRSSSLNTPPFVGSRDQYVSSAPSCSSWRRGVLGRADLSAALYKDAVGRTDGVANARLGGKLFFILRKKKGNQSSIFLFNMLSGHQDYLCIINRYALVWSRTRIVGLQIC